MKLNNIARRSFECAGRHSVAPSVDCSPIHNSEFFFLFSVITDAFRGSCLLFNFLLWISSQANFLRCLGDAHLQLCNSSAVKIRYLRRTSIDLLCKSLYMTDCRVAYLQHNNLAGKCHFVSLFVPWQEYSFFRIIVLEWTPDSKIPFLLASVDLVSYAAN